MFTVRPISFADLVSPLSQNKIFILLEVLDPTKCESLDCSIAIAKFLGIRIDEIPNNYEVFLRSGFMTIESELSTDNQQGAEATVDFFRQQHIRDAVKAYLFINQVFIGHSADGHTAVLDFLREKAPAYA